MQSDKQNRKYVTLAEALSWIAFRTFDDAAAIKERLRNDPACQTTLEEAAEMFSNAAGDGRLRARGRFVTDADDNRQIKAGHTDDISENSFRDFQQVDLDRGSLQRLQLGGSRVLGTWSIATVAYAPNGKAPLTRKWLGSVHETYSHAFARYAGSVSDKSANLADVYDDVEVMREDLLREFRPYPNLSKNSVRGRPRQINRDDLCARARTMLKDQPGISLTSAAASIARVIEPNPKTGKLRDARGIEKIIAPLWQRGEEK